ncbi:hypothetical protein [Acidiphilium sp.]|uniref:hypothetical protein n=1 Tax=Acidiphilium sp. TaxID=527 RepID=UPI003CFD5DF3
MDQRVGIRDSGVIKPDVRQSLLFYGLIAMAGMAIEITCSLNGIGRVVRGGLIDPDSFMRLVRIGQGLRLGHLVNVVQRDDSGAPMVIEWSRLFDWLIVALATPLAPWLGWHRALFVAGVATGPLSAGGLAAGLAFAASAVGGRNWAWTVPAIGLLQPGIMGFAGFGIIHYHIAQIALVAFCVGFALRAAGVEPPRKAGCDRMGWACGASGGLALWLMPETMPFVLLSFVGLGYVWLFRPIGRMMLRLGGGFVVTLTLALLIDPPHGGIGVAEVDRLSIVYVWLGVVVSVVGLGLACLDRVCRVAGLRIGLGIGGAVAAFGLWLGRFPDVALGPYGVIPARDMRVFFGHMSETQPVHGFAQAALLLGPGGLALLYGMHRAWRARAAPIGCGGWMLFSAGVALSLGLTARFVIFQQYPAAAVAGLLPVVLDDASAYWLAQPRRAMLARIGVIALLLVGPYGPGVAMATAAPQASPARCRLRHIASLLHVAAGAVVLTPIQDVPELLYRTQIIAVGSLYQHGIRGYLRARRAWRSPVGVVEPTAVAATLAAFVLVCERRERRIAGNRPRGNGVGERQLGAARTDRTTLAGALQAGLVPPWLRLVGQDGANGFRLYRIIVSGRR